MSADTSTIRQQAIRIAESLLELRLKISLILGFVQSAASAKIISLQ